jgi:hypothetical protein
MSSSAASGRNSPMFTASDIAPSRGYILIWREMIALGGDLARESWFDPRWGQQIELSSPQTIVATGYSGFCNKANQTFPASPSKAGITG